MRSARQTRLTGRGETVDRVESGRRVGRPLVLLLTLALLVVVPLEACNLNGQPGLPSQGSGADVTSGTGGSRSSDTPTTGGGVSPGDMTATGGSMNSSPEVPDADSGTVADAGLPTDADAGVAETPTGNPVD